MTHPSPPQLPASAGAYARLRELIISGALPPSAALSEPELAERLGVSRTPVREALKTLIAEGLVLRLPSTRAVVAPVSAGEIRQVYDIRSRLEGLIARDASARITEADKAALERMLSLMERLSDDYAEVTRIGAEFHGMLEQISGNSLCTHLIQLLRGHVDRYRAFTTREPGRAAQAVAEHRLVFEAIASGNPDRAEAAMRQHIDQAGHAAMDWADKFTPTTERAVP